jgi:uncharacterized membrane protein YbhN (UPF0104 family)
MVFISLVFVGFFASEGAVLASFGKARKANFLGIGCIGTVAGVIVPGRRDHSFFAGLWARGGRHCHTALASGEAPEVDRCVLTS